ncbi:hypothetical protein [Roseibium sp. MMSF_3412]|uniref:hypothetical protein n=1 Tax=Roseibium sp. MMSF_3412 TaxID=3046712 RepID=UPI00273D9C84|nr:hypothetical protein [Roseibium sp. MMSF_3412]
MADGSEADYRAGVYLAREAHQTRSSATSRFPKKKRVLFFEKATAQPNRFGLIYAVQRGAEPLAEDGHYGFASVHAGEYFLGTGTLIATVQTLNVSRKVSGTFLGGKAALQLLKAMRHRAKMRNFEHLIVHVTNGVDAEGTDKFFRRCGMTTVGGNYCSAG